MKRIDKLRLTVQQHEKQHGQHYEGALLIIKPDTGEAKASIFYRDGSTEIFYTEDAAQARALLDERKAQYPPAQDAELYLVCLPDNGRTAWRAGA